MMGADGFVVFDADPLVTAWADAAARAAGRITTDPDIAARNLRHGNTWFVGVDALPNTPDGAIHGVPLAGPWDGLVPALPLHPAQLSVIYPGYPRRDTDQSEANHRYRTYRCAAHVDGLLPEGPQRRRFARECHAYILGIPLDDAGDAPTVVWPGSQRIMQAALARAIGDHAPGDVDLTDAYHAARRTVFDTCDPVAITVAKGQSFLIHRHALHGTAPWSGTGTTPRAIAFFRPEYPDPMDWLRPSA